MASLWLGVALSFVCSARAQGVVGVEGTHLIRDGKPWIPHGFHQIAFAVAPGALQGAPPFFAVAARNYKPQEYAQMKEHGADSVRIQVAQNGLDHDGQYHTQEFQDRVLGAVRAARTAGLTVILSIQNEEQTGQEQQKAELPSDATERIWRVIAPLLKDDRGVMFEVFNEPRIRPIPPTGPTEGQWATWAGAMNRMVRVVRSSGAKNVIIADGLQRAETLRGAPHLDDPLRQVVYASHPYAHAAADQCPEAWDEKFGEFARTAPVMISEWGIGYYCDLYTPKATEQFLQYLQDHGIGLQVVAWDWAPATFGSFNYGFPNSQVSSFQGAACSGGRNTPAGFGLGKMVERWYTTGSPSVGGTRERADAAPVPACRVPSGKVPRGVHASL